MKLLDVYQRYDLDFVRARGCELWTSDGQRYLDFYGGHGVISIGHNHETFVTALSEQLQKIIFYTNSIRMPQQEAICELLGDLSGYPDYNLFMVNSGAEANENALKIAAIVTGRSKIICFSGAFHGRTALTMALTDMPAAQSALSHGLDVVQLPLNDLGALEQAMSNDVAAVIIEGIQGVGGVFQATPAFAEKLRNLCTEYAALLIVDEIQSGCGRSGAFFAHQKWLDQGTESKKVIQADIVTMAKGIGNGFPVAALISRPDLEIKKGMLGTTFGGSYLASVAVITVLRTIVKESLLRNAERCGRELRQGLKNLPGIKDVRGMGLMIGIDFEKPVAEIRSGLIKKGILTGYSDATKTLRLIPPLNLTSDHIDEFLEHLGAIL